MFAILILAYELIQIQGLPWYTQKYQLILTGLALLPGAVQMGAGTQYNTKLFTLLSGTGGKYTHQVGIGLLRSGIAAIITTQYIRRQGSHLLAATATLGGFILPRIVIEQVFMGRGHQGLNTVGRRGFAGTITTGKQIDPTKLHFGLRNVAPVDVNHFLQIHDLFSLFRTGEQGGFNGIMSLRFFVIRLR